MSQLGGLLVHWRELKVLDIDIANGQFGIPVEIWISILFVFENCHCEFGIIPL